MNKFSLRFCALLLVGGAGFGYFRYLSSNSISQTPEPESTIIKDFSEEDDKEKDYHIGDEEFWDKALKAACMDSYGSDLKYICKHEIEKIEVIAHWVEVSGDNIRYHISFRAPYRDSFDYYHAQLDENLDVKGSGSGGGMPKDALAIKDCGEDKIYKSVYTYNTGYKDGLDEIEADGVTLKYEENGEVIEQKYIYERNSNKLLEKTSNSFIDENKAIKILSKDSGVDEEVIRNADEDTWMYLMMFNGLDTTKQIYHYQFTDKGYTYKYELDAVSGKIITKDVQKDIGEKGALDIAMQKAGLTEDSFWSPAGGYARFLVAPDVKKETLSGSSVYKVSISANDNKHYYYEISADSGKIFKSMLTENYIIDKKSGSANNTTFEIHSEDKASKRSINLKDLGMDDIYDYKDFVYLKLQLEGDNVVDWGIVDVEEGTILGKLSADELFEEYYFDKKYKHSDAGHLTKNQNIYLSKQKEGIVYDYYVEYRCAPQIINDLGEDIILYWKEIGRFGREDDSVRYNRIPYLNNDLYNYSSRGGGGCGGQEGYTYSVLYKKASSRDILKTVRPYEIYYLSSGGNYNVGDEIDRDYDMEYIYNDTKDDVKLKFFNRVSYNNDLDEGTIVTLHPDEWAYANSVTTLTIVGKDEVEGQIPSKPITKEIAEKYINGEINDSEMRKYKSIDVGGARMLAEYYTGNDPELGGLETISAEAAAELAKFKGDYFRFDHLKSLSAEAATELAKFKGGYMSLNGLESLDADVAAGLAKYRGDLAPDATDERASRFGPILTLNGLKTINVEAATELAKSRSSHLSFEGLTDIDVEAAEALAKYNGYYLHFKSLKELTPEIVVAFNSRDELFFEGFDSIDVETAIALSKFSGDSIHLGITEITPEIAKALSRFKGGKLGLDSLTSLDKDSASYLSRYRGKLLRLMGLTKVDDDVAKELANYKGQLDVSSYYKIEEKIKTVNDNSHINQ